MKSACVLAVLVCVLSNFSSAQAQTTRPLDAASEQIKRVEILYFPEQILVPALTPERLEQLYLYKLEIRDLRESPEWERLLPHLRQTSLTASDDHGYDHRMAVLLFDKDGHRIASVYFDTFGRRGTINGKSGTISGGMYRWGKSLLKGVAE